MRGIRNPDVEMKSVVEAFSVGRKALGLVLGGNLILQAVRLKDNVVDKMIP